MLLPRLWTRTFSKFSLLLPVYFYCTLYADIYTGIRIHIIIRGLNRSFCVPKAKILAPSKMLRSHELQSVFCLIPYAVGLNRMLLRGFLNLTQTFSNNTS